MMSIGSRNVDQRLKDWRDQLSTIHEDIAGLLGSRIVFRELQAIVAANPRIHKPSRFYRWLPWMYRDAMVMGVRRQADTGGRCVSLAKLLAEIQQAPGLITRDDFVSRWPPEERCKADREFDKFSGPGGQHLDCSVPCRDLAALRSKARALRAFANRRVAHLDKQPPKLRATSSGLDECLDLLEALLKKYLLLVKGDALDYIAPVPQEPWKDIFREAWIPEDHDSDGSAV